MLAAREEASPRTAHAHRSQARLQHVLSEDEASRPETALRRETIRHGQGELRSECANALRAVCERAPFGDAPHSTDPPYSACQLLWWVAGQRDGSQFRLPTSHELRTITRSTIAHVGSSNRQRLGVALQALALRAEAIDMHSALPDMPWLEPLRLRHGAASLLQQLRELPPIDTDAAAPDEPFDLFVDRIFDPVERLRDRMDAWARLEAAATARAVPASAKGLRPPPASKPQRYQHSDCEATVEATLHDGRAWCLESTQPVEGDGAAESLRAHRHMQVRVRLSCASGGPIQVRGPRSWPRAAPTAM